MNTAYNQYSLYLKHLLQVECAEKNLDFDKIFSSYLVSGSNPPDTPKHDVEQDNWNMCMTREDFEDYLMKYPNGKYASVAKNKIAEIDEKVEDDFWNACETKEDYERYLKEYPNGRYVKQANKIINEISSPIPDTPKTPKRGDLEFEDGYYVGETKNGLMHGHGTRFWDENEKKWTGDWVDGKACGHVVVSFGDFIAYDGQMENGLPNGPGVYTDINSGQRYEGNFVDFKREGEGVLYTEDGDKIYDGEWKNNRYHGYGMFFLRGQCRYDGLWENGKRNGDGIAYNEKGIEEYNGPWKDDVRLNDIDRIQAAANE